MRHHTTNHLQLHTIFFTDNARVGNKAPDFFPLLQTFGTSGTLDLSLEPLEPVEPLERHGSLEPQEPL